MLAEVSNDFFASFLKLENSLVETQFLGLSQASLIISFCSLKTGRLRGRWRTEKGRSGPELWWKWCSTVRIGTDPELQSYSGKSVKTVSIKNWPLPLCDFQLRNWRSSALRCKIQIGGHCLGRDLPCEGIVSGKSYFQTVQRLSIHFYITRLGSRIPPFVNSIPQVLSNPLTAWIHLSWVWPHFWSRRPFTRLNHPLRLRTGNDVTVHQKDFFWFGRSPTRSHPCCKTLGPCGWPIKYLTALKISCVAALVNAIQSWVRQFRMVYDPFGTKVDAKKALNICKYCVPSVLGKWYLGCEFANQQN